MLKIHCIHSSETYPFQLTDSFVSHGMALFETIYIRNGELLFWKRHWDRLLKSAHFFKFDSVLCQSEDSVLSAIQKLYGEQASSSSILKLSLFQSNEHLHLFLYFRDKSDYRGPKNLCLNMDYPINEKALLAGHKTHNYFENMWLLQEARKNGFFDYLRVNRLQNIAETTISNVFFKIKDQFVTPSLASGVLPGVVRSVLLEMDQLYESIISIEDLNTVEAIYLGNSVQGIIPIDAVFNTKGERVFEQMDVFEEDSCLLCQHLKVIEKVEAFKLN